MMRNCSPHIAVQKSANASLASNSSIFAARLFGLVSATKESYSAMVGVRAARSRVTLRRKVLSSQSSEGVIRNLFNLSNTSLSMKLTSGGLGHLNPDSGGRTITSAPVVKRLKRANTLVSPGPVEVTMPLASIFATLSLFEKKRASFVTSLVEPSLARAVTFKALPTPAFSNINRSSERITATVSGTLSLSSGAP